MKLKYHITIIGMLALAGISSCGEDGQNDANSFDQGPLLDNLASNLILPSYQGFTDEATSLESHVNALIENLTQENLEAVRTQLKTTRLAWQRCSFYQIGPAETHGLSSVSNLFPIDVNQIERNIEEGNYDLAQTSNFDARGLPAIAYLVHGESGLNDEAVLISLENTDRKTYLSDITSLMASTANTTLAAWKADGGNYLAQFTSSDALGVSVGSSVAQLINAFLQYYERNIRDGKVGIPVGIRSLGVAIPENVEAFYAGYSLELLRESIVSMREMYNGGTGVGFDDYLIALEAVSTNNDDLAAEIDDQFARIIAAIDAVADPLEEAIVNDKVSVEQIFAEMQALATLMKTDMSSQIGIGITYQDSDGD